ncbi:hypothetical protein SODALDRAFT_360566 [Sodiomyces alkalinus F11]|uniref:Uncharacterized protein n=1 Tax=Sodiomyces alkalinus (strain CBS 110278 / VKM F-3762 / F11) TaxID=1314773 RepID=A0A3N2PUN9_SODAK|nr:hypothetical protein SODALDRAFT_360566 [Sodiomyces alkalinus F11]ROT38223.1 hypothetical protein SODALDRAFT_360566 [Sodiomyces alkalinus F11]
MDLLMDREELEIFTDQRKNSLPPKLQGSIHVTVPQFFYPYPSASLPFFAPSSPANNLQSPSSYFGKPQLPMEYQPWHGSTLDFRFRLREITSFPLARLSLRGVTLPGAHYIMSERSRVDPAVRSRTWREDGTRVLRPEKLGFGIPSRFFHVLQIGPWMRPLMSVKLGSHKTKMQAL